jgi:hypothetical protein
MMHLIPNSDHEEEEVEEEVVAEYEPKNQPISA